MKNFKIMLSTLVVSLSFMVSANAFTIIDDFDTDQAFISAGIGQTVSSSVSGAGILGLERDLVVTNYGALNDAFVASIGVTNGNLTFSADSTVDATFWMQWDGVDGSGDLNTSGLVDANTGLGIDLTGGLVMSEFETETLFADEDYIFNVELWWNNGLESETVAVLGPGHEDFDNPRYALLDFSVFNFADLTNISAIQVGGNIAAPAEYLDFIDGNDIAEGSRVQAFDVTVGGIQVVHSVPEPAAFALFGLGLLGFAAKRRKIKNV